MALSLDPYIYKDFKMSFLVVSIVSVTDIVYPQPAKFVSPLSSLPGYYSSALFQLEFCTERWNRKRNDFLSDKKKKKWEVWEDLPHCLLWMFIQWRVTWWLELLHHLVTTWDVKTAKIWNIHIKHIQNTP